MESLDEAIVAEYQAFDVPADQIVADPAVGRQFLSRVKKKLSPEVEVDLATLNKRILNLRRRGGDKGGLPRIRRPR